MKVFVCILLAVLALTAFARHHKPKYAEVYKLEAVMSLPYADLHMPMTIYYDGAVQAMRVEKYEGLNTYIYNSARNFTVEYLPRNYDDVCFFQDQMQVDMVNYLPSLSGFRYGGQKNINGVRCDFWSLTQIKGAKENTYTFYADATTAMPVRYDLKGKNTLNGSHYDHYVLDYKTYVPYTHAIPAGKFDKPVDVKKCYKGLAGDSSGPSIDAISMMLMPNHKQESLNEKMFKEHMKKFGGDHTEDKKDEYLKNKRVIDVINSSNVGYTLKENHMMTMSAEEKSIMRGTRVSEQKIENTYVPVTSSKDDLPTYVNWVEKGVVSTVKDQAICGSCFAFSAIESLESRYRIVTGTSKDEYVLSQQNIMDCSWDYGNSACDGGEIPDVYKYIMDTKSGVMKAADYGPYLMADGRCHYDASKGAVQVSSYTKVHTDEHSVMDAVAHKGPLAIAINAAMPDFSFFGTGVYTNMKCGGELKDLDHGVLLVGYGTSIETNTDYWLVQNSWSTHWGDAGLIKMNRKDNMCGIMTTPYFVEIAN